MTQFKAEYGDVERAYVDVLIVSKILGRQGSQLLFDVIAQQNLKAVEQFKLQPYERQILIASLVNNFEQTLIMALS